MSGGRAGAMIEVTIVEAPLCHLCDHAHGVLADLSETYPIRVRSIELDSPEGLAVLRRSGAPFPPVVLVDGRPFSHGRLSARKLEDHLRRLGAG